MALSNLRSLPMQASFLRLGFVAKGEESLACHGSYSCCQLCHDRIHENPRSFSGRVKLGFQLVHQCHKLINFGDDPALFGEGGG